MQTCATHCAAVFAAAALRAGVGLPGHGVDPGLRGLQTHLHVDQLVADHLVRHQRLAEGPALARPVQRLVEAGLGKTQRGDRHAQPLGID